MANNAYKNQHGKIVTVKLSKGQSKEKDICPLCVHFQNHPGLVPDKSKMECCLDCESGLIAKNQYYKK